ncbi:MAG: hypothetical protein AAFY41_16760 [Bacteroidota bacterium]
MCQLTLGYVVDPVGPFIPGVTLVPTNLLTRQAVDLTMIWYWDGEPYGMLQILEYVFEIQID